MEENEGTQICPNCNRDIPKVNFVTHSVHCVRNIKICPVCKEPVLQSELDEHNEKLHQLVPCRQCGEMVRGTDMEDHTRDSCAFTMQSCRFCSLELRRREVPAHERYCGARTERCADCGEYVMMRYRQLHLDSNHGFVRLREDSPPRPAIRGVEDPTQVRPPAISRPRFPPYVPLTDLVRPNTNREETLRLIAEFRAREAEAENEYTAKVSDEELRFKILATIPIRLPTADERGRNDAGYSRLRLREQLIANLRGQTRLREQPRFNEEQVNVIRVNEARRNGEDDDFEDPRPPRMRIRRRPFRDSVIVRNEVAPDAAEQNVVAPDTAEQNVVAPNVEARDTGVPNAEATDEITPNTDAQDVGVLNAEATDETTPNTDAQDVEVLNAEATDETTPNTDAQDVEVLNAEAKNAAVPNTDARDVEERNAETRDAAVSKTDAQDVGAPTAEARDAAAPKTETRSAGAENVEAHDSGMTNAEVHDVGTKNIEARDVAPSNAVMPDVMAAKIMTGDTGSQDAAAEVSDAREASAAANIETDTTELAEMTRLRSSTGSRTRSNYRLILKRTNDQPQINTAVTAQDKILKKLGTRSAVKKRPAPAAPVPSTVSPAIATPAVPAARTPQMMPDPRHNLAYYSALRRRQAEEIRRQEQTAYNLSVGLPPVLDPAAKLEKLRKMDPLLNREVEQPEYRHRLQGRVWSDNNNTPAGYTLGHGPTNTNASNGRLEPLTQSADVDRQRRQLADLQPMSPEQFMERFNELQLIKEPRDIRSSLRELRRGLNEVTAPYNNANNNNNNNNHDNNNKETNKNNNVIEREINKILRNAGVPDPELDEARAPSPEADVMVPCEFCCEPLRAVHILDHERACRLGLSSARGLAATPTPPATPSPPSRPESPWDDENIPVIPCEFCTETLPFYLINEHQELCGRESQLLYPD